jgi:hypothetical protein
MVQAAFPQGNEETGWAPKPVWPYEAEKYPGLHSESNSNFPVVRRVI